MKARYAIAVATFVASTAPVLASEVVQVRSRVFHGQEAQVSARDGVPAGTAAFSKDVRALDLPASVHGRDALGVVEPARTRPAHTRMDLDTSVSGRV